MKYISPPDGYDLSRSILDWALGGLRWYRKLRGGYWKYSLTTFVWWRYVLRTQVTEELVEDYRS